MSRDLEKAITALGHAATALNQAASAIPPQMPQRTTAEHLLDTSADTRDVGVRHQELRALALRAERLETDARGLLTEDE
jgi:hypothetical protein